MRKLISIIFVITFLTLSLSDIKAKPVDKTTAEKAVIGWLKSDPIRMGVKLGESFSVTEAYGDINGEPAYYVVYLKGGGFVITPADDMVEPIIAIVEQGVYTDTDEMPLGALVRNDIPARVRAVRQLAQGASMSINSQLRTSTETAKSKWEQLAGADGEAAPLGLPGLSDVRVAPLIQSKWGQSYIYIGSTKYACYNYYTPPGPDGSWENYPCGCVATSMAQLMRYHEYPGSYTWSNMPLDPSNGITPLERRAIGSLCYDTAESVDTVYGEGGSSAIMTDADPALEGDFYYFNSIYETNPSTGTALNNMINPNLDSAHPVLLGLLYGMSGHAVVCDGYGYNSSTLYHHLNMGWYGQEDAWYNLPDVDAGYPGPYDTVSCCIYNIFISESGEIISGRVTDIIGNPIEGVTVTATGGGTYQDMTNSDGIYAMVGVPSAQSFTVSASKPPYVFANQYISTGTSYDGGSTSGNKWGVNFSSSSEGPPTAFSQDVLTVPGTTEIITLVAADDGLPNPPGQLSYIITALPQHGTLTDPGASEIVNVPYTIADNNNVVEYWSCSYYDGEDSFNFKANDGGTSPTGGDSELVTVNIDVNGTVNIIFEPQTNTYASWPIDTYYHDQRTEVIYLSGDIGEALTITDLALDIYDIPGQMLNNWTIRMKHTSRSVFSSSPFFETTGWTTVFQNNESITSSGWHNFHFDSPFEYNGTQNLMIDFSYNNSSYTIESSCMVSDTGNERVVLSFADSTHGDPLTWNDYTCPGIYTATAVPNLKLSGTTGGEPIVGDISIDCSVDFVDFSALSAAWFSNSGEPDFDEKCDISDPADGTINSHDLESLVENWLIE